jgi:primosomal protein N' (replication factor Y)
LLLHGPSLGPPEAQRLPLPPEAELRELLPAGISLTIDPDPLQL